MKKQRVWIYCRVSEQGEKCLLEFQEDILTNLADQLDLKVVGVTKEISNGENLDSFRSQAMMNCIRRKRVEIILSVTPNRISVREDIYEEFEMLCNMKRISVIALKDLLSIEQLLEAILKIMSQLRISCRDPPPSYIFKLGEEEENI